MATSGQNWGWKLCLALLAMGGAIAARSDSALAQITPDGTLSAESSVVTPTNANGLPSNQIDGGAARELISSIALMSFLYPLVVRHSSTMPWTFRTSLAG